MNWGEDNAMPSQPERCEPTAVPDPLRRKVMSVLASMVDKHRRVLEKHEQVVITIYMDWREGTVKETVMAVPDGRIGVLSKVEDLRSSL